MCYTTVYRDQSSLTLTYPTLDSCITYMYLLQIWLYMVYRQEIDQVEFDVVPITDISRPVCQFPIDQRSLPGNNTQYGRFYVKLRRVVHRR